ncbi:MAG: hypothetical protein WCF81_12460 [Roseiarcus sp.]
MTTIRRGSFSKDLLACTYADLREPFDTPKTCNAHCTIPNRLPDGRVALARGLFCRSLAATAS